MLAWCDLPWGPTPPLRSGPRTPPKGRDVKLAARVRTAKGDIRISEATRGTLRLRTETGAITIGAAAGVSAALDAGTTIGRIRNSLKNSGGAADLTIHATTTVGDITARSL